MTTTEAAAKLKELGYKTVRYERLKFLSGELWRALAMKDVAKKCGRIARITSYGETKQEALEKLVQLAEKFK
jgi:sialic acid synthase SpsE